MGLALVALAPVAMARTATVYLRYDNSDSKAPYPQMFAAGSWDESGAFDDTWSGFERFALSDDGLHGDEAAGDGIWGGVAEVQAGTGATFMFAADCDQCGDNGWIGIGQTFEVPDDVAAMAVDFHLGILWMRTMGSVGWMMVGSPSKDAVRGEYDRPLHPVCIPCAGTHPTGLAIARLIPWQTKVSQSETGRMQVELNSAARINPGDEVRLELYSVEGALQRQYQKTAAALVTFDIEPCLLEGGYHCIATIVNGDNEYDRADRVYSVVNDMWNDVRYGFYTNFGSVGGDYVKKTDILVDLYINAIEYYDYFPAHGVYAPTELIYNAEPFGGTIYLQDVLNKMSEAREKNILNIAYIAAYAGAPDLVNSISNSHLTNSAGNWLAFYGGEVGIDFELDGLWYYLTAFAPDTPWRTYLWEELTRTLQDNEGDYVAFDGFEIDTYGYTGDYYSAGSAYNGTPMNTMLPQFAADVRDLVHSVKSYGMTTMNNLAEQNILQMFDKVDFLFVENWKWHKPNYHQVVEMVYYNSKESRQRFVSKSYPADTEMNVTAWPAENLRYLMGSHLAGGGSFMVAGEPRESTGQIGGLNSLYYPDNQPQSEENYSIIRNYNKHDAALYRYTHGKNVARPGNDLAIPDCMIYKTRPEDSNSYVWNILHNKDNWLWAVQNSDPGVIEIYEITYAMPAGEAPEAVYWGTPDNDWMVYPVALDWEFENGNLRFAIPELHYYGTLIVKFSRL